MHSGAWQATVPGVERVRPDLATRPPPPPCLDWGLETLEVKCLSCHIKVVFVRLLTGQVSFASSFQTLLVGIKFPKGVKFSS